MKNNSQYLYNLKDTDKYKNIERDRHTRCSNSTVVKISRLIRHKNNFE